MKAFSNSGVSHDSKRRAPVPYDIASLARPRKAPLRSTLLALRVPLRSSEVTHDRRGMIVSVDALRECPV